jgi:ParB/RepB/Spo0J family partition protein
MEFDPNYIAKLAKDMETEGQNKPIYVRPHPTEKDRYQLIDGEHRVRALQKLGRPLVRAEIHARLSDEEAFVKALRINQEHGMPLKELEEARHINKMKGLFDYSEEQIGKCFTRSQSWVRDRLTLALSLAPKVEEHVSTRVLTLRHAIEIAQLPKEEQIVVAEKIANTVKSGGKFSTRATQALVHALKEAETPEKKQRILEKPLEVYAELYRKKPEALERAMAPEAEVLLQRFDCPCGCGHYLLVQWNERKGEWRKK